MVRDARFAISAAHYRTTDSIDWGYARLWWSFGFQFLERSGFGKGVYAVCPHVVQLYGSHLVPVYSASITSFPGSSNCLR